MHQVLEEWNRTRKAYPELTGTDELIAAQAQRTPAAIAVCMGSRRLTYSELETGANQLAHYLSHQGVAPGTRVGVCMERSLETVAALLAVQKSGAAYVPLDPAFPKARLQFMAEDAGLALTLTHSSLLETLAELPTLKLTLDAVAREIAQQPTDSPGHVGAPDDLAYIMYTSGSTGKPKGVEVTHRGLTNLLWSMQSEPGCTSNDTLLSITTLSFDISGLELYLPLIVGGRVELASRAEAGDPAKLIETLAACRPSIMQATPATWRMLIDAGWAGDSRLTVICGGEALSRDLADRLLERCATLWNGYGPTETTIYSTLERVPRNSEPVTIGRPIANTQVYILDAGKQPVPVGVEGEIYIGGHGVARGYHGRPDLTQERFSADAFSNELQARLYRTGDLGRFLPDGRIVHHGRLDMQVKIRGFRIEPGEIETALARHAGVAQAVVAAKPDASGFQQLVAYLIPRTAPPSIGALRTHLESSLPSYMVPSHFMFLDAFPLTASHKIDINALPEPSAVVRTLSPAAAPGSALEVQLTALWRQVLSNDSIGIHDNFFEVGGHSLNAAELFSHIHEVFGTRLPPATLFQAPTIAQLAVLLSDGGWRLSQRSLVAIQPRGNAVPVFAVPGVGGDVLVFAKLAKLLGTQQPFYGLQPHGLGDGKKQFMTVGAAARHYIAEIRSVRPRGPYFIAGTCTGGVYAYEIAQQLIAQGEAVTLALLEVFHPISYVRTGRLASLLWPIRFLASKVALYASGIAELRLREWGAFLKSKAQRATASLLGETDESHGDGTFGSARLVSTTLQAVAAYEPEPYPGGILHVIAANRPVSLDTPDTRQLWSQLASAPSRTVSLPAEDSGRLFVSPHVDDMAVELARYARTQISPDCSSNTAEKTSWSASAPVIAQHR